MTQQFTSATRSTLAAGINSTDTVLTLATGSGTLFPVADANDWWYLVLQDSTGSEVVKVTAHTAGTDTLTVTRGQLGTTPRAFAAGAAAVMLGATLDVQDFGADSTGAADSTTAIKAAIAAGKASGKIVVAASGTYAISGTIVINTSVDFSNAVFMVSNNPAYAIDVSSGNYDASGNPTDYLTNLDVRLPERLVNANQPSTGWSGAGVGVRVANIYDSRIWTREIRGFQTGLYVTATNNNGCGYNDFFIGYLVTNQINLHIGPLDTGWVNECNWYGGRYAIDSNQGANIPGTRHIQIDTALNYVNNHVFYKPCIEGNGPEFHIDTYGSYCTFVNARYEASPCNIRINRDPNNLSTGVNNVFSGGYGVDSIQWTFNPAQAGQGLQVYGYNLNSYTVNSSTTGHCYNNITSSSAPMMSFYAQYNHPQTAAANSWISQYGTDYVRLKQQSDTYSRISLDARGYIFLDNGTLAENSKTCAIMAMGASTGIGFTKGLYPYDLSDSSSTSGANLYDLGNTTRPWRNFYINSIIASQNITATGNITASNITAATTTTTSSASYKMTSDAYSRIYIDAQAGRIYFDDGTTPDNQKTCAIKNMGASTGIGFTCGVYPSNDSPNLGDSTYDLGNPAHQWRDLYINNIYASSNMYATAFNVTSDAREKTPVTKFSQKELQAARLLSAEIGTYQWLKDVAAQGNAAKLQIGLTVQRIIEIMQSCGLDPSRYDFIQHDTWAATPATDTEPERLAGDRYSLNSSQFLLFLAAAFNDRLAALEKAKTV